MFHPSRQSLVGGCIVLVAGAAVVALSDEYASADRREQYYGDMHWDIAGPVLRQKFGVR